MAYDITSKTSPLNTEYEDSKNFNHAVQVAHDEAQLERQRRANQPSKYTQTLQAINSTLQTVNSGLQVAQNVNTLYDQITTNSFKRDQLEKQNRLKEQIQGAINENDWNKVATIAMANVSTASQMPEYMDTLGRMAKISGNEGSAALLRSVNTQQQGKLELEELKNLGKLQVAQERNKGTIAAANIKGQWAYKTGLTREQMKQEGEDRRAQWGYINSNQQKLMEEEGKNYRTEVGIAAGKHSKGRAGTNPVQKQLQNKFLGDQPMVTPSPTPTPTSTPSTQSGEVPQVGTQGGGSPSYMEDFRNYTYSLLGSRETEQVNNKLQSIEDAGRAPSKEEQDKANANKQRSQLAEQETKEFAASFENDELNSVMLNFPEIKGTDGASKLTYALNNPDEYEFKHVTEPSAVTKIINGKDNNLSINNLSDKYKDVVQVTQIRDKKTGQVQNLYLKSDQAKKLNDISNFNNEKVQMYKEAMKPKGSPTPTPTQTPTSNKRVLTKEEKTFVANEIRNNPDYGKKLATNYGIDPTPENLDIIADYIAYKNPNPSPEELNTYVNKYSIQDANDDLLIRGVAMVDELQTFNEGKEDMMLDDKPLAYKYNERDAIMAFNKSIKKSIYTSKARPEYYEYQKGNKSKEELILDPYKDITKLQPTEIENVKKLSLLNLKQDYPDIYKIYLWGKTINRHTNTNLNREAKTFRNDIKDKKIKEEKEEKLLKASNFR